MKIAGINVIQYNNNLRNNTDIKMKYSNTPDLAPDSFVKSTATQPTNVQDVSFGHNFEEMIGKTVKFSDLPSIIATFDKEIFKKTQKFLRLLNLDDLNVVSRSNKKRCIYRLMGNFMVDVPEYNARVSLAANGKLDNINFDANGKNNSGSLRPGYAGIYSKNYNKDKNVLNVYLDESCISDDYLHYYVTKGINGPKIVRKVKGGDYDKITLEQLKNGAKKLVVDDVEEGYEDFHNYYSYIIDKDGKEMFKVYPFANRETRGTNTPRRDILLYKNEKGELMIQEGDLEIPYDKVLLSKVADLKNLDLTPREIFKLEDLYDEKLKGAKRQLLREEDLIAVMNKKIKELLPGIGSVENLPNITQEKLMQSMLDATKNVAE